jgi:hypothetical protein
MTVHLYKSAAAANAERREMAKVLGPKAKLPKPTQVIYTGAVSPGQCGLRVQPSHVSPSPGQRLWILWDASAKEYNECGLRKAR